MSRNGKPKRRCCHWKPEEVEALKTFSREYSDQQIAILLDRTPSGVGAMRGQLGIKRMEQPAHLQKKRETVSIPAPLSDSEPLLPQQQGRRDPIPRWVDRLQGDALEGAGRDYQRAVVGLLEAAEDLACEHRSFEFFEESNVAGRWPTPTPLNEAMETIRTAIQQVEGWPAFPVWKERRETMAAVKNPDQDGADNELDRDFPPMCWGPSHVEIFKAALELWAEGYMIDAWQHLLNAGLVKDEEHKGYEARGDEICRLARELASSQEHHRTRERHLYEQGQLFEHLFAQHGQDLLVACPQCRTDYLHLESVKVLTKPHSFHICPNGIQLGPEGSSEGGRGSAVRVQFWGECGHRHIMEIGFHKGQSFLRLLMLEDCLHENPYESGEFTPPGELWRD